MTYGKPPVPVGHFPIQLPEVMYYLYLPVSMPVGTKSNPFNETRLPRNVEVCRPLIEAAIEYCGRGRYMYVYLSARKGWATPDNPLNRPGWHCDGFGTEDMNFVWWQGPGTRFAIGDFGEISTDHVRSQREFADRIHKSQTRTAHEMGHMQIDSPPEQYLYAIDPYVVHATPLIGAPGCMRQYIKVSLSNERYNLENNSHNYLFDYEWELHGREEIRNDPHRAQRDSA